MERSRLTRDGTAEPVSRGQIVRRERGQGNMHFPYSADHEQDWQPYPVDPYSCYMCDHTYIVVYASNPFNKNTDLYCTRVAITSKLRRVRLPLVLAFSCHIEPK